MEKRKKKVNNNMYGNYDESVESHSLVSRKLARIESTKTTLTALFILLVLVGRDKYEIMLHIGWISRVIQLSGISLVPRQNTHTLDSLSVYALRVH